jgi:hypothetical protein
MWAGVTRKLAWIKFSPSLVSQILKIRKNRNRATKFKKSLYKKNGVNLILVKKKAVVVFDLEPLKWSLIK